MRWSAPNPRHGSRNDRALSEWALWEKPWQLPLRRLRHAELLADPRHDFAPLLVEGREPAAQQGEGFRRCGLRRPGIERWRRIVLDLQLDLFRHLLALENRGHRQR